MNKIRILVACICLGVAMSVHAGSEGEVLKAIQDAKAANKKADSLQGAWVTTGKLIKKAEAAAEKGDTATAIKLANKAKREAELAYTQAAYEKDNWSPPPYIR